MSKAMELLFQAISDGEFDNELDNIIEAVKDRRGVIARRNLRSVKVGDMVRFSDKTHPVYLRGLAAKVTKVNGASVKVTIKNDPAYGRFSGRIIGVPASLVERV